MFKNRIETDRLILRPFTLNDIMPTYQMESDARVNEFTHDGGIKPLEVIEKLIHTLINVDYKLQGFGRFAIEWKESNEFIGFCGLKYLEDLDEIDLGYRLKVKYWERGLATEACKASLEFGFDVLKLKRIIALIVPENKKSLRVLQKLDFQFEKDFQEDGLTIHQYVINNRTS